MTPFIAEFIGTAVLVFLGDGVVANVALRDTKGHNSGWIVIVTGWAMAVFVAVVIAAPFSGAHLNPAVSVGLALAGKFSWSQVPAYIAAQFIGAIVGAGLVWLTHKDHFDRTDDPGLQLAVFSTRPSIRNPLRNLVCETTATFILLVSVLYFTKATIVGSASSRVFLPGETAVVGLGSIGALPVAFVIWAIGLSLGGTTGYAINPARDLGPRLAHTLLPMKGKGSSDWAYAPIPLLGPLFGAVLAALMFKGLS